MNVAKLFLVNIILGVAFILLAGCSSTPIECEISMSDSCAYAVAAQVIEDNAGAMCSTDSECELLDGYLLQVDPSNAQPAVIALAWALQLKASCEADPEDLLDQQECPQ